MCEKKYCGGKASKILCIVEAKPRKFCVLWRQSLEDFVSVEATSASDPSGSEQCSIFPTSHFKLHHETLPVKALPWADKESDPSLKISSREIGEIQKTCITIRETVVQTKRGNKPNNANVIKEKAIVPEEPLPLGSPRKTVPFDTQGKGDAPSSRLERKEKRDTLVVNKEMGSEQLNLDNRLESNVRKIKVQLSGHQYNVCEAEQLKNIRQNSNEEIKSQIEAPIEDLSEKLPFVSCFLIDSSACRRWHLQTTNGVSVRKLFLHTVGVETILNQKYQKSLKIVVSSGIAKRQYTDHNSYPSGINNFFEVDPFGQNRVQR
ncbi:unnamed protein product [Larinioides sclopetarius]|uniref:Uncharacterized protein n=1 Tax=Larinioides sclopetarius TaxID=280406 RepID=A0AAV2A8S4_9ARAC